MKYSIYNTILPLSEKLGLVYCGATDQFVVFQKRLTPLLKSVSADQLAKEAPCLYAELVKGGAIVHDQEDEFAKLKKLGEEIVRSPKSYRLIINPTIDCNFKCWYCYETHIARSKMQQDTLNRVLLLISNIMGKQKGLETFNLSFFGGEPLIYYNEVVRPILDHTRKECTDRNIHLIVGFTSNGFLINDSIVSHLIDGKELKCFQITLDGNREKHDKTRFPKRGEGSYDKILSNIKRLLENEIEVILRINYTATNILSVRDVIEDIVTINEDKRKLLTISFHRVWQDRRVHNLPDSIVSDTIELFRKEFRNVTDALSMNNLRNPCYADSLNEAVVNFDGNIFKCTARDFSTKNRCGILSKKGRIIWNKRAQSRITAKFHNRICYICRLFPLCGGGCSQKAIELYGENNCVEGLSNEDMDMVVMQRFYDCFIR